jgi:hypothetical protein
MARIDMNIIKSLMAEDLFFLNPYQKDIVAKLYSENPRLLPERIRRELPTMPDILD